MTAAIPRKSSASSDLWDQLDQDQAGSGGVLRACAMTLVVTAADDADAEDVRQHAGRADARSSLARHRADRAGLAEKVRSSTRVFSRVLDAFRKHQQICAEGIEITADAASLEEVAQLLVP